MSKDKYKEEKIERYLDGLLSDEETKAMKESISTDEQLALTVEEQKVLLDGIKFSGRNKLKARFDEWDSTIASPEQETQTTHRTLRIPRLAIAASITLMIVSSVVVYNYLGTGYDRIASRHFEPTIIDDGQMRGEKTNSEEITAIYRDYNEGKYAVAIEGIQAISEGQRSDKMNYALAISYLAEERANDAIPILQDLAANAKKYELSAQWYLSLAYLMNKDIDAALPILQELSTTRSRNASKAQELLDDLD